MDLPSLDLNLVVVLQALLEERNVTRAGRRVGLSQSGASTALARLRRHFDDPVLVRAEGGYQLTPLAVALQAQLGPLLQQLTDVVNAQPRFDPATTRRRFAIGCSDSVLAVLGPRISAAVERQAPGVVLDFRALDGRLLTDPDAVLQDVDLLISSRGTVALPGVPNADLYQDRWVCLAWRGNTDVPEQLGLDDVRRAGWVIPFHDVVPATPADTALSGLSIERRCAVRCESFASLPRLLVGTGHLALVPQRLVPRPAEGDLRELRMPVALPPITQAAWWYAGRRLDPGHQWLVATLRAEATGVDPLPG
ncbi:LysR substrate-binding domain-containing protein [Klenkia sp. PcliD-1-E]|uniref:LysR substrate-binding domain-containing protein n=1 Tax=Klenkia sp. PcliD-1-E TaxID=2954492 RepID=UPI002097034D|nr:LysR substrate-binding domain-containing protein [Klenkia sp. PcliD-1-E]MCO7218278.1 LysR family transcriptional regulator [Klenkia sp. PcliD-1-E]